MKNAQATAARKHRLNASAEQKRRSSARARSSNPVLRDAWERGGVLACGQCCKSLTSTKYSGVVSATWPADMLETATCSPACVKVLTR